MRDFFDSKVNFEPSSYLLQEDRNVVATINESTLKRRVFFILKVLVLAKIRRKFKIV